MSEQKILRTCTKCGANFYGVAEFAEHVKKCDGNQPEEKPAPKKKGTAKSGFDKQPSKDKE